MTNEIKARALLTRMVVPPHKMDPTKPTTVQWLLSYLRGRNLRHPAYIEAMELLIDIAVGNNWIKKSEQRSFEHHITMMKTEGADAVEALAAPAKPQYSTAIKEHASSTIKFVEPNDGYVPMANDPVMTVHRPTMHGNQPRPKITIAPIRERTLAERTARAMEILRAAARQ